MPHFVPWYSVGPAIGLVVNACLLVLCLALAVTHTQFKALRSLSVFYLSLFVYFLGYTFYGFQNSPESITFWYGTMMLGLAWMPFTWGWFASDLRGGKRSFMFIYTMMAGVIFSAALILIHHPAVLSGPLEFLPLPEIRREYDQKLRQFQQWIVRVLRFF